MDTKSKNYEQFGENQRSAEFESENEARENAPQRSCSRLLRAVTSNKVKITAFVIICICAFVAITFAIKTLRLNNQIGWQLLSGDYNEEYITSDSFQNNKDNLYYTLCAVATTYLRSCDGEKYTGSEELLTSLNSQIRQYDIDSDVEISVDDNGNPVIQSDMFDFYVSFKNCGVITNIDSLKGKYLSESDIADFESGDCWIVRSHNRISTSDNFNIKTDYKSTYCEYTVYNDEEEYNTYSVPVGWSGYDNYGRYIMCYGSWENLYVYDFDPNDSKNAYIINGYITEKLDSSYDTDENPNGYYDFTWETDENGHEVLYATTYLEDSPSYRFTLLSDNDITLLIRPKQEQYLAGQADYASVLNQGKSYARRVFVSGGIGVASLVYLLAVCGYRSTEPKGKRWSKAYIIGNWWVEALLVAGVAVGFLAAFGLASFPEIDSHAKELLGMSEETTNLLLSGAVVVLGSFALSAFIAIVCKLKSRSFIKDLYISRLFKRLFTALKKAGVFRIYKQQSLSRKLFIRQWIFIIATIAVAVIVAMNFGYREYYSGDYVYVKRFFGIEAPSAVAIIAYVVYLVWFMITQFGIYRDLESFNRQLERVCRGEETDEALPENSLIHSSSVMLGELSDNVKQTVEKQVQSERMKVELVTNVSHDLKTPLTSIISYIDLLKSEEMSQEAKDYVKILEQKSDKLKDIVADVFTLAKATSGVEVEEEKLDAVILLNQALADSADKIEKSGRRIKAEIEPETAPIIGDGAKLCRVFQNLIDNALSYSMEGTRIFLSMKEEGQYFVIEIKNTASYEMEFTPDEIVERFTRGDKSRTDGGNGLGLSIAKTFTEACGGRFEVEVDGDVFKAIVTMHKS